MRTFYVGIALRAIVAVPFAVGTCDGRVALPAAGFPSPVTFTIKVGAADFAGGFLPGEAGPTQVFTVAARVALAAESFSVGATYAHPGIATQYLI